MDEYEFEMPFEDDAYEMDSDELNEHEMNELDRDRECGEFDDEDPADVDLDYMLEPGDLPGDEGPDYEG